MGIVFKNNAKTTLASNLSNSATSATVTDGSVFPTLGAGEFFLITFDDGTNNEICKCTARSSNTLTIVRAQDNTSARAFSSGDAAEGRVTAGVLETIQENIAAKSANQTVYNATTASSATAYNIGTDPGVEANAMVFLDGVMQHHDTFSFSGSTLTFDAAPVDGTKLEVIVDNLINLQSSNLTVDTFTAADVGGSAQTDFTLSDTPAAETNLIVFVEGVFQDQDAYTISSNTLSITTGVIAGRGVTVYVINPVNIGTPSDGTITSAKLSGNLTLPGTLTVGANDVAFDSPTFVVDNSNSRVGLGTASPTVPVDIVGETKMSSHLTLGTNSKVQFRDTAIYINSSADGQLDLVADTEIQIAATTIDVNGNLDVSGTTVSAGKITADAGIDIDNINIDGTTINLSSGDLTINAANDLILTATDIRPRTDLFVLNNAANNKNQIVVQSGAVKLFYDGAEQLETVSGAVYINNKLGIGTTSPSGKFEVVDSGIMDINLIGNPPELNLEDSSGTSGQKRARITLNDQLLNIQGLSDDDGSITQQLITGDLSNGNVGIGTTSPDTLLNLESAAPILRGTDSDDTDKYGQIEFDNGDIVISADANGGGGYHSGSSIKFCVDSGSERMRITNDGYVGIRDTTPDAVLKVNSTGGGSELAFKVADASDNSVFEVQGGGTAVFQYGKVGIGTTSPANTLQVANSGGSYWAFKIDCSSSDYGAHARGVGNYAWAVLSTSTGTYRGRWDFSGTLYTTDGTVHDIDSDERLKEEITDCPSQWSLIKDLPLQRFKWKDRRNGESYSYGWVAQPTKTKYPEFVEKIPQPVEDIEEGKEDPEYLTVRSGDIQRRSIAALQEAMARIETLEATIEALQKEVEELKGG